MSLTSHRGIAAACLCLVSGAAIAIPQASTTGSCGPSIQGQGQEMSGSMPMSADEGGAPQAAPQTEVAMAAPASPATVESAPAPAEPEPVAAASAPAPAESSPAAAPAPKPRKVKAWWPSRTDGKLNILDVRSGEFSKTIVVQTDGKFQSAEAAASAIQVSSADGQAIDAKWTVGANGKTLLLPVKPGRYTVKIGTQLADASGKAVAKDSSGSVEVH